MRPSSLHPTRSRVIRRGRRTWPRPTAACARATLDDLEWADGYALGTPSRFGGPAAQLRQFLDRAGGLWARGALQDKAATAFTAASNAHGGQEAVLLALNTLYCHWGAILVPPGYTHPSIAAAGGNPYGISAMRGPDGRVPEEALTAARYHGTRLTAFAALLATRRADQRAA